MTVHHLKTWPRPFELVLTGVKRFEWRRNDRDFQTGDDLVLEEYDPPPAEGFTGRRLRARITYVLSSGFGLPEGYCVLSLSEPVPL